MNRQLTSKEKRDMRTLARFVTLFCRFHHTERTPFDFNIPGLEGLLDTGIEVCRECAKLLKYGLTMRLRCPREPKPMCKKCPDPCYKPGYRETIREVMRFSGMYMVKRGRIDLMYHYFR